jgi:hypothetical protein
VEVEIDIALDPDRIGEIERHFRQPPAEDRRQMQPSGDHFLDRLAEVFPRAGRRVEQMQRAHVHRRRFGLQTEKSAVETAQILHGSPLKRRDANDPAPDPATPGTGIGFSMNHFRGRAMGRPRIARAIG